jgi:UDP-N-acetyl-D-mannosaminuronic acid dehydrogenase
VGGHCISVDPWFFVESAPDLSQLILQARLVNDAQPSAVVEMVKKTLSDLSMRGLKGKKIAVLGLAYKPDVDDLRESPAAEVVRLLQKEGAVVKAFEPFKPDADLPGVDAALTLEAALAGAEVVILLVSHTEFRTLTPQRLASLTTARILVDTVNGFSGKDWHAAGFKLYRLGVSK